jgi:hypothetical protein
MQTPTANPKTPILAKYCKKVVFLMLRSEVCQVVDYALSKRASFIFKDGRKMDELMPAGILLPFPTEEHLAEAENASGMLRSGSIKNS